MIIRGGLIFDAIHEAPYQADIWVRKGKILQIASEILAPEEEIFSAEGLNIYPGFVEAHGHSGLDGYGIGYEGQDYNEMNDPISPQLRAIDAIQPMDRALVDAKRAGVTTLCIGPGSANVLGGTFCAFKPVGKCIDDMIIKAEVAMKCAFGENPKRCYQDKSITTRMSTAANLREMLFRAREYAEKIDRAAKEPDKMPAFDMKLHALLPVIRREIPLKAHAHQADDLLTALRIAREFSVDITLEHVTEGHLILEELKRADVPVAVGPTLGHATKFELRNISWETPGALQRAGLSVSIITDSPVIPQEYLPLCAGLAIKGGMDPFAALQAITINPAKHIGIADRVGSIEQGKDADLVLMHGSPFELDPKLARVMINGAFI